MKDWTSLLYEVTKLSISKNIYFSADVFDFLQQQQPRRFFHHIKNAIDARKRITAPIEIPAFSHPVRSREEKKKTGMRLSASILAYYENITSRSELFL